MAKGLKLVGYTCLHPGYIKPCDPFGIVWLVDGKHRHHYCVHYESEDLYLPSNMITDDVMWVKQKDQNSYKELIDKMIEQTNECNYKNIIDQAKTNKE